MKAIDIIMYLKARLPAFTDLFNDVFTISSLTRVGTTVTAVTTTDHNLSNDDLAHISGALSPNPIISLRLATENEKTEIINYLKSKGREYRTLLSMSIVMAKTSNNHQITELWNDDEVIVSGATETDYNGTHRLVRQQNRKNFSYAISETPSTPATGSPILIENPPFGYNGLQQITFINSTSFSYEITGTPGSPAEGTPKAKTNPRISGAISAERCVNSYTVQSTNELWAYVVLGDTVTSKDRNALSDATATRVPGYVYRMRELSSFTIYVFTPSTAKISGRSQRDLMEDVNVYLSKSILGAIFASEFVDSTSHQVIPIAHGLFNDSGAYIIHKFDYEVSYDITVGDIVSPGVNVAFRDIKLKFRKYFEDDNVEIMSTQVDLDDIPE